MRMRPPLRPHRQTDRAHPRRPYTRDVPRTPSRLLLRSLPRPAASFLVAAAALTAITGCGVDPEVLMTTPVVYQGEEIDLLEMVPEPRRSLDVNIFYATNREIAPEGSAYTNTPTSDLRVGQATVRFGDSDYTWDALRADCATEQRAKPVGLDLTAVAEDATFAQFGFARPRAPLDERQQAWFDAINAELRISPTDDIIIYVHGAKVNFYNGCVFASQVDHFVGRQMVPIALCWPTHQDIFAYISGEDIGRGQESAYALAGLLDQLAANTNAERIHVVCWSAGGRVTSKALSLLREAYPYLDVHGLAKKFRIGTVVFAAADVEVARFLNRIHPIADIAGRVIITVSDSDEALALSKFTMGGDARLGQWREENEYDREVIRSTQDVEIIDVSYFSDARGFDIKGHRYWFQHPWASSDLMMAIRFDLSADKRGLVPADLPNMWGMPPDYPERVRKIVVPLVGAPAKQAE